MQQREEKKRKKKILLQRRDISELYLEKTATTTEDRLVKINDTRTEIESEIQKQNMKTTESGQQLWTEK